MKLTKALRQAFVLAVMADVPEIDYEEQIQITLQKGLDDNFFKLFGTERKKLSDAGWMGPNLYVEINSGIYWLYGPCHRDGDERLVGEEAMKKARELSAKLKQQREDRRKLEEMLTSVAAGCTTRKALAEALPEFEKYLPSTPAAPAANLPALANVVSAFVQAGWPKGGNTQTT